VVPVAAVPEERSTVQRVRDAAKLNTVPETRASY
jgi:hypothetical protein